MLLATRRPGLPVLFLAALFWLSALSFGQMAAPMPPISIQAQIDAAPDGGTVVIAAGVYNESLSVDKNITLSGESSATTEIRAVPGQRVITVTGGHDLRLINLKVSGGQAVGEVGGGVKVSNGSLFVEGCVISGNSADYGGGIFQEGASNRVKLTGSRIEDNGAGVDGGGLYARGETLLQQTDVLSNTAGRDGGGVYVHTGSAAVIGGLFSNDRAYGGNGGALNVNNALSITGTRFITNSATQSGGAVLQWNSGWPVVVSDAVFERNSATVQGGGLWSRGNVTITGSALISNTVIITGANSAGGGAYLAGAFAYVATSTLQGNQALCQNCMTAMGGGLALSSATLGDIRGSSFTGNYAWSGGGVSSDSGSLWVRDSIFTGNSGGYGAGLDARSAVIRRSLFQANSVVNQGGAVSVGMDLSIEQSRFASNSAGAGGGAIRSGGAMRADNVVLMANTAAWGGSALRLENSVARSLSHLTIAMPGAASGQGILVTAGSVAITNTILASYTTGITVSAGATVTANGVLWSNIVARTTGSGSFTADDEWFGAPAFAADGYHLLAGSAAIDHGVASGISSDIDGNSRPWGAGYDLGAVEFPRSRIFLPMVVRG